MVDENLIQAEPGPMSMARWVTTASRVCGLHVATCKPGIDLYSLTHLSCFIYHSILRVECCTRTVTEAAGGSMYGSEARDGYIRAVLRSRHVMTSFESKHKFQA